MVCTGKFNSLINDLTNNKQFIPSNKGIIDANICSINNSINGLFIFNFYNVRLRM
jgi:hypothetical protein